MNNKRDCRGQEGEIVRCGAGVMERYWNDPELMSKIASKMGAMQLAPGKPKAAKKAVQALTPRPLSLHTLPHI